jgi:hypothetical protein
MIKICIDTNAFHDNWLLSGEVFTFLADFIAKGLGEVYVSEITILEHVRHFQKKGPGIESNLKSGLSNHAKLFGGKLIPLPPIIDVVGFEKLFRKRLDELGIKTLGIPEVSQADLIKRDLAEKKPFTSAGKGYRDALTWLGFLTEIDDGTTKAVVVTNDANDYCGSDQTSLHNDLLAEIHQKNPDCIGLRFAAPQKLVDDLVKPLLKLADEEEEKTLAFLKRIQSDKYKHFKLEDVVIENLENFQSQEPHGVFFGGDVPLEEPLWITMIDDPYDIKATALFKLSNGKFVCEGSANVTATVEGYLSKFDAFNQSANGRVSIATANCNDHYSEVEVPNVPARVRFSFEFEAGSGDILKFDVNNVESNY